jgi:mono/diheme cytochrome c family protein
MLRVNAMKILTLVFVAMLVAGLALAEEKAPKEKKVTGKELYKTHCKACHTKDSDAGEYTPMTLIEEQWEEFFDELWIETHGEVVCPKDDTKKVTDMWNEEMLKAVRKFCVDHAADSEQPMTCG